MKCSVALLVLGFVISSCSAAYIKTGSEYVYDYVTSVSSGSEDYTSFASTYNISGTVRLQKSTATLITVKFEDLKFSTYNGEFSYTNQPEGVAKAFQELNPLTEPFQVKLDGNNLAESIVLSESIPEWARNIQRGLATTLQIDTAKISQKETSFEVVEKTITGECPTAYQVIKTEAGSNLLKARSHNKCENRPIQVRRPGMSATPVVTENSRNVLNSTSYGSYYVEAFNGEVTLKRVTVGSGVIFSIFGPKGHTQYAWTSSTFNLKEVKSSGFSQIPAPSSPKTHDNLRYVFESSYTDDDDLQKAHAYFPHIKDASTDETFLKNTADDLYSRVQRLASSLETTEVYEDMNKFHQVTPLELIPLISALPYSHLKSLYARVKSSDKKTEIQIFHDTLVICGTNPAALLIRDIVDSTKEPGVIGRLLAPFPNYIRNPTEKLLKEFEPLIQKTDLTKHQLRTVQFAYASLVGRVCAKTQCRSSGLLEKYVKYFSDKYDAADNFEEKTVAIGGLRNIASASSGAKLLTIAVDATADKSVRIQAIAGVRTLPTKDVREPLLQIFFDRSNDAELRTTAGSVYLSYHFEVDYARQMVVAMWTEPCKYVKNYLYTYLEGLAHTTFPHLSSKSIDAKNLLATFPKWTIDRTLSGHYLRDYQDKDFSFGAMTQIAVQKTGESVLPASIFVKIAGNIGGYAHAPVALFARLEGLGKAVADRIMSMSTGQISFDEVKKVFAEVGVKERTATPLRVEFAILLHGRVVAYHAADAKTITTIPMLLKKIQEMQSTYEVEITRTALLGGVTIEQPSEFGTPVSAIASAYALAGIKVKTNRQKEGTAISSTSDYRFQSHVFGYAQLNNHLPAFGSVHSVAALRGLRLRLPRHLSFGVDLKQMTLKWGVETPTKEDPIIVVAHATAITTVWSDSGKKSEAVDRLKASCPTCAPIAVISKGPTHKGTRQIGLPEVSRLAVFEGVKRGAKFFDCEKPHSRYQTLKKVAKYFGEQNKNTGKLTTSRILVGLGYMIDSIFLSPPTATCGIKAYYYQDPEGKSVLKKIEGETRVKYTADANKKLGAKIQFKSSVNFVHEGSDPQNRLVEVTGQVALTGMNKRDIKLRFLAKDKKTGKNGVLCFESSTEATKFTDILGFEGADEPTFERKININWGPEPAGKDACPVTDAYIKATRKSHRSQEQKEEASSNVWPYKQCREQKGSAHYPGTATPGTYECMGAVLEQTNLRESNISVEYQVDVEARNRWKKPMVVLAAFLVPYWETETSALATHVHSTHEEHSGSAEYVKGTLEVDVSARKENPSLDIHWHSSKGDEHFHNVDLAAIPGPLRIKPVFSRFSPFFDTAFKTGLFGYCLATPATVMTFDNNTYHADMSECPTLLSADCDDKPRYAVISRKLAADKVGVTIHVGDHKIDLDSLDKAVVDGKDVPITESVYTDSDEEKLFKFVKISPTYVAVLADKLALYVGYTGSAVTVTAGTRYRATACGLCGNFDGNKYNDFVGPDATCKGLGPKEMMKAYIVREGNCASTGSACPATA